jgi:hypothetical protein
VRFLRFSRIDIRGDGKKDSTRGYAVTIPNRDEAIAAAREASGERGAEIEQEITREMFEELNLKPGEVRCIFEWGDPSLTFGARRRRSGSDAKDDVHDGFDFTETLRVEVEGDFDVFVVLPGDLEGEACGCELNEPQAVVAGVGIVIEGLDVADAAIVILELTLNEKIGLIGGRQIQVIVAKVIVIERDLEVFAAGFSDGHMFSVESHWRWPCLGDFLRPYFVPDCQKGRRKATAPRASRRCDVRLECAPWSMYVRCWANTGRHLLAASISGFDPTRTSGLAGQQPEML